MLEGHGVGSGAWPPSPLSLPLFLLPGLVFNPAECWAGRWKVGSGVLVNV